MADWKILLTDGLEDNGLEILRQNARVDALTGVSAAELLNLIENYDALVVRGRTRVTEEVLNTGRKLRVVGRSGVGVDNIDLNAARARQVIVVNAPLSTSVAVAELTFGLILALSRSLTAADARMKQGEWNKKQLQGVELSGKIIGIIGLGNIGRMTAARAAAFGMQVIGFDPLLPAEEISRRGAQPVQLDEIYALADFISLHIPLTDESRNLIDRDAFTKMKAGVRIVCTARGGIIDEGALLAALQDGKVAGAGLDVFAQEPPGSSALVAHPNVIATPHIGAQTAEAQVRAAADIAGEVLAALRSEPLRWRVA